MTTLQSIRARLAALPGREQRARRVGRLLAYIAEVQASAQKLDDALVAQRLVRKVFPESRSDRADAASRRARGHAEKLHALLASDPMAIDGTDADTLLTQIREQTSAARTAVRNEWREQVDAVLARYRELVGAADAAHLTAGQRLLAVLADIDRQLDVPTTPERAAAIQDHLEQLANTVRDLGLEGAVARFLQAVATRRGDARDLSDPAVNAFLTTHHMWDKLAVVFR